jgi:hypothetical protein
MLKTKRDKTPIKIKSRNEVIIGTDKNVVKAPSQWLIPFTAPAIFFN